jgi:hypothetical protein
MNSRRNFLKSLGISSALLLEGGYVSASEFLAYRNKVIMRFIVASDGHYG